MSKRKLVQEGHDTCVVASFHGVPCSVDVYHNDNDAIRRFNELVAIHTDVSRRQNGREPVVEHLEIEKGRRVKTSRSGLPACRFDDGFSVTAVRGPVYGSGTPAGMEYVATCANGSLSVVCFEDKAMARKKFKEIRDSYDDDPSLMADNPDKDGHSAFSTDEISIAFGTADIVRKGEICQLQ